MHKGGSVSVRCNRLPSTVGCGHELPWVEGTTERPWWKTRSTGREALAGLGRSTVRAMGALGKFCCKTPTPLHWMCWKWDFSKDLYPAKLRGGGCVCFFKRGTAKGTSVTIANSDSKARDTGVSQSTVIRWWWLFFVWLNNIFSLNPTWPPLAESHKNNKGKRKPAWNRYPAWKILGSTLNLANL